MINLWSILQPYQVMFICQAYIFCHAYIFCQTAPDVYLEIKKTHITHYVKSANKELIL